MNSQRDYGAIARTFSAAIVVVVIVLAGLVAYFAIPRTGNSISTGPSSMGLITSSSLTSSFLTTSQFSGASNFLSSSISKSIFFTSSSTITTTSPTDYSADWVTYHYDHARDGFYSIGPNITAPRLAWKSPILDGQVYAEPLYAAGRVYVATENNSVYALNATTGQIIWRQELGQPVTSNTLPCGDIGPVSGITGTPVIDLTSSMIYVVAFLSPGVHDLFGLSIITGLIHVVQTVDPPSNQQSPIDIQQRGALALNGGYVYVAFGGLTGDCATYQGWVVGVNLSDTSNVNYYEVPCGNKCGIWAPSGLAINAQGDIFAATGNSDNVTTFDYGESVIELSPTLSFMGYFAPSNWSQLNANDIDLGSTGPLLLGSSLVFQVGKEGVGYILNESNLGGVGGQIFSAQVCPSSGLAFGGEAYSYPYIYVACSTGLVALKVSFGSSGFPSFSIQWTNQTIFASPPVIVGGAVWTIDRSSSNLYAYSPSSGVLLYSVGLANVVHFETPSAGPGFIFAAAGNQIYGVALT